MMLTVFGRSCQTNAVQKPFADTDRAKQLPGFGLSKAARGVRRALGLVLSEAVDLERRGRVGHRGRRRAVGFGQSGDWSQGTLFCSSDRETRPKPLLQSSDSVRAVQLLKNASRTRLSLRSSLTELPVRCITNREFGMHLSKRQFWGKR